MQLIRITYKLFFLCMLALIAVPVMFFLSFGSDKSVPNKKQIAYRTAWQKKVVQVIGLNLQVNGRNLTDDGNSSVNDSETPSALWVANHISWMDIAVLGSQGVGFLSKSEIRQWPVIGWLGEKSGTVFIQRGGKNASQIAATAIANKIASGDSILVFPEGTTSSGENVRRFHARIFAPALDHQLLVQPIVLQYLDDNGRVHPKAAWDDQNFFSNLIGVLAQARINVVLTYLPIIDSQEFTERRQIASTIETQIRDVVLSTTTIKIA